MEEQKMKLDKELTPMERLMSTIQKEEVDRPPCICPGGMMNMVTRDLMQKIGVFLPDAHHDPEKMAALAEAVYREQCFENVGVPFCMTVEAEEMGAPVDFGSDIFEPHVVGYPINSVTEFRQLKELDLVNGRSRVVVDAIRLLRERLKDVPVVANITGPVSTITSVMEPTVFYKELRKKNMEAHACMRFVTDQLIAYGRAMVEAGADVVAISDPSGTGEVLGPKYFKEFTVTYLNRLLDGIREGMPEGRLITIVHICGQMDAVFNEVNEVTSDALSFDAIVPVKKAREVMPERILMGNVSTYALEFADPEKIQSITRACLSSGLNIISPACGLGMKSPLVNVQTVLKTVRESVL